MRGKQRFRREKQKEGGSNSCVCVYVCVVSVCVVGFWDLVFWLATFSAYTGNSNGHLANENTSP